MPLLIAGSPSGFCLLLLLVAVVASSTLPLFLPAGERLPVARLLAAPWFWSEWD